MDYDFRTQEERRVAALWSSIGLFLVLIVAVAVGWFLVNKIKNTRREFGGKLLLVPAPVKEFPSLPMVEQKPKIVWEFKPGPISMDTIKKKGCVADGFLSEYGENTDEMVKLIDRSECVYLHRAMETWLKPPDFSDALDIMMQVKKKQVIYGMFLAEAITSNKEYDDPIEDKEYHFSDMCRAGTDGRWGPNTCVPSIQKVEYRRYLRAVTRRAMDLGIQSFLFGQIVLQDENPTYAGTEIEKVIKDMRDYAKKKKMQIIIGGQTDSITDERYLRMFDYVEGGLGLGEDGRIEMGECWSRMSNCWALLWHDKYRNQANNTLLHLDWSGLVWDDMGVFTRMDHDRRVERLNYLYNFFTSRDMGFMMPFLAVINHENGGCYGPNKSFYSPSNKYKCKDENDINKIMRGSYK
ncbi:hypothetical protein EPO05_01945 [Patescibacteria group bacterium]|nr:MAG: hypothetical protein EPO05_01945 [Patescibacteria group bacterium]